MSSLHQLISNGGKVLVVGGWEDDWPKFRNHPQLVFWSGDQAKIQRQVQGGLPDNVKAVIMSRFLKHSEGGTVIAEARKKQALIIPTRDNGEVARKLTEIVTPDQPSLPTVEAPKPKEQKPVTLRTWDRGEQRKFVADHHSPEGTHAAEGRRLFKLAEESGIKTTEQSMAQAVYKFRQTLGILGPKAKAKAARATITKSTPPRQIPRAKPPATEMDTLLSMLDDAMTTLGLLKEKVAAIKKRDDLEAGIKGKLQHLLEELG